MNLRRPVATVAALLALAAPAPSAAAGRAGPAAAPTVVPGEDEMLTVIGEYVDGAVTVVVDPETGEERVVEDTRGDVHPGHDAGSPAAAAAGDGCTNADVFSYIAWGNPPVREARPWKAPEQVHFNPAHAPSNMTRAVWEAEILAGSDVWEDTANLCGFADTVGWITPDKGADSAVELPDDPFDFDGNPDTGRRCVSTRDNENTVGWQDMLDPGLVAAACVWSTGLIGGKRWTHEGDVIFNTDQTFCPGPCADYDLRAVAAHEFGHYLGLGHSCGTEFAGDPNPPCGPAGEAAVMYPFLVGHRTLSLGDVDGAETLYPAELGYQIDNVTLVDPEPNPNKLAPGHEYTLRVDLKNSGLRSWKVNDARFVLSTRTQSASEFAGSDWPTTSRPSRVDQDLSNHANDGGRIPDDLNTLTREEVGRFTFKVKMPLARETQAPPLEALDLLRDEGGLQFANGDPISEVFDIGTFGSAFEDQLAVPLVVQGVESIEALLDLENTGTVPWYVNETITAAASDGAGTDRCSVLDGSDWLDCFTASKLDQNVTATVVPVLPNTSPVLPGQVGRFKFKFASPIDPALIGLHSETFEAKLLGGRFVGSPTTFTLVVL